MWYYKARWVMSMTVQQQVVQKVYSVRMVADANESFVTTRQNEGSELFE
jgi:hypothetical protein